MKDHADKSLRGIKPSYDLEDATLLAQWTWENRSEYHAILLTGDMANTGHIDDLKTAYKFLTSTPPHHDKSWLTADDFPTIINSSKNIFLLPGNHDRFNFPDRKPNNKNFDEVFTDYWSYGTYVRGKNSTIFLSDNREVGLSIISVDFSLEDEDHTEKTPVSLISRHSFAYYGQGKAYDDRIAALVDATKRIKNEFPNYPVIWALHYELLSNEHNMKLIDESTFIDAIRENDVTCVINGHTHNQKRQIITGGCTAITGASPIANPHLFSVFNTSHLFSVDENAFSVIDFHINGNAIVDIKVNPVKYKNNDIEPWVFSR